MRERAALLGGTLEASAADGTFRIQRPTALRRQRRDVIRVACCSSTTTT